MMIKVLYLISGLQSDLAKFSPGWSPLFLYLPMADRHFGYQKKTVLWSKFDQWVVKFGRPAMNGVTCCVIHYVQSWQLTGYYNLEGHNNLIDFPLSYTVWCPHESITTSWLLSFCTLCPTTYCRHVFRRFCV